MSIRAFAFLLIAAASLAAAAPPKSKAPKEAPPSDAGQPAETIDVDAMARAKDVDPNAPAQTPPPEEAAPATEAPPSESPATEAAPATAASEPEAPAAEAKPAAPPTSPEKSIAAGCEARATALLDDAEKADYGSATRDFDAKMRTALPAAAFKQQWESLAQFGKLTARGQSHLTKGPDYQGGDYTVVMIPLLFEKANLVAQIACGSDGRIAGFHVTQAPKPKL